MNTFLLMMIFVVLLTMWEWRVVHGPMKELREALQKERRAHAKELAQLQGQVRHFEKLTHQLPKHLRDQRAS
ncbi:MAG: hypothetical protein ABJB74_12560 [Gemmatimonas sp.]